MYIGEGALGPPCRNMMWYQWPSGLALVCLGKAELGPPHAELSGEG